MEHHRIYAASYVILQKGDEVLLGRRCNTGYMDGKYGIPAGHIEEGGSATLAAIREAREEIGVSIRPQDLQIIHVMKRKGSDREYADFFFVARAWEGEPAIAEPDKCDDLGWFSRGDLPDMISYERLVLESATVPVPHLLFTEYGYQAS